MKRENAKCDECRFAYTICDGFAQRYPKMAEECSDYWPVETWYNEKDNWNKDF